MVNSQRFGRGKNKPMSKTTLVFWVLAAQMLIWLLIWRNLQDSKVTGRTALAFCLTAFLSAAILVVFSETSKIVIFAAVMASALASNIVNILYDLWRDPTSHNLFPFELVMTAFISLVGAGIGVGIAASRRKSRFGL
jgi:hypothetical protein